MNNLTQDPTYAPRLQAMNPRMWQIPVASGDYSLFNTHYPLMRIAAAGPVYFSV
jgi:hypothetical protein